MKSKGSKAENEELRNYIWENVDITECGGSVELKGDI